MNLSKTFFVVLLVLGMVVAGGLSASAHSVFKKEMEKKYPGMKVSCNACHVEKKPKTERNPFGNLFHKQMESLELTKNWKEKKGSEKKDYETNVMIPEFEKAMTKIAAMTYDEIIKSGLVEGIADPNAETAEDDDHADSE